MVGKSSASTSAMASSRACCLLDSEVPSVRPDATVPVSECRTDGVFILGRRGTVDGSPKTVSSSFPLSRL